MLRAGRDSYPTALSSPEVWSLRLMHDMMIYSGVYRCWHCCTLLQKAALEEKNQALQTKVYFQKSC